MALMIPGGALILGQQLSNKAVDMAETEANTTADAFPTHARSTGLVLPMLDGRTREFKILNGARAELEARLGPASSFEARQLAEQILRHRHDIAILERRRGDAGLLSERDAALKQRAENALSRALARLERMVPPKPREPSLADHLTHHYGQTPHAVA